MNPLKLPPPPSILVTPALAIPALGVLSASLVWCINDYHAFLTLGRGGVPYNVFGWAIVTFLVRPFAISVKETVDVREYPKEGASLALMELEGRMGQRPTVRGIAPHRQMSQNAPESMREPLQDVFDEVVERYPAILEKKRSLYERHHDAIFVHSSLLSSYTSNIPGTAHLSRGEIAHIHHDLSMHLHFSPGDARKVIENGWGERHRLARTKKWMGLLDLNVFRVGGTYLMVYGPRDEGELKAVRALVEASVRYMTGREL